MKGNNMYQSREMLFKSKNWKKEEKTKNNVQYPTEDNNAFIWGNTSQISIDLGGEEGTLNLEERTSIAVSLKYKTLDEYNFLYCCVWLWCRLMRRIKKIYAIRKEF